MEWTHIEEKDAEAQNYENHELPCFYFKALKWYKGSHRHLVLHLTSIISMD
jgi:hypothetical protein